MKIIHNTDIINEVSMTIYDLTTLLWVSTLPNKKIEEQLKLYVYDLEPRWFECYERDGYIKFIKSKKNVWESVRLTKKGEELVKSMFERPVNSLAQECLNILLELYEKHDIKNKVNNKKKTLHYINEWLNYKEDEKGIVYTTDQFRAVIECYINSFPFKELKFIKNSLKLFFNPSNVYASKWNVDDCPFESFINSTDKSEIMRYYKKSP